MNQSHQKRKSKNSTPTHHVTTTMRLSTRKYTIHNHQQTTTTMNTFSRRTYILAFAVASMCLLCRPAYAFSTCKTVAKTHNTALLSTTNDSHGMTEIPTPEISRRSIFQKAMIASFAAFVAKTTTSAPAFALESSSAANDLDSYLYKIIRVREATQQERRLIQTGKFKDIQRANVKLAVKFMVSNYRLADCVLGASAYLKGGNSAQMRAIDVGQTAVQNLQTILEYFDTSDVENIKVRGRMVAVMWTTKLF
jgi:hypothetical protein